MADQRDATPGRIRTPAAHPGRKVGARHGVCNAVALGKKIEQYRDDVSDIALRLEEQLAIVEEISEQKLDLEQRKQLTEGEVDSLNSQLGLLLADLAEQALRDGLKQLKLGALAITPDGPRGPANVMAEGLPLMAKLSKAPVLFIGLSCSPAIRRASPEHSLTPATRSMSASAAICAASWSAYWRARAA